MTQTCVNNMNDVFQNTVKRLTKRHICKRFSEDVYPAAGLPLSYQPHIYYVHHKTAFVSCSHFMQAWAACNSHVVNIWLSLSLLGLHHSSRVDLRSHLQIQLNQLHINHKCHIKGPIWTYALYKPLACYNGHGVGSLTQPLYAAVVAVTLSPRSPYLRFKLDMADPLPSCIMPTIQAM